VTLAVTALVLHCALSQGVAAAELPRGTPNQVVFTQYSPLFSNPEIVRRLLSPLARKDVHDSLVRELATLTPYPIDLSKEKFLLYVPSGPPPSPRGYALLVFVPPWDEARLPFGWASQLNHYGVIFVTPAHAGNTANVLSRRVPLALSAEQNVVGRYPVDRQRIYIGGFSGGSRVALRIALGYPDIFHGALLHAGANPLGDGFPLPPRDLFQRFQSASHLIYVTGASDTGNLGTDASSSESLRQWCVFDVETHEIPGEGHEVMSSTAFGRALGRVLSREPPDPARLGACRARIAAELEGRLSQVEELISRSNPGAAREVLLDIDRRYGGLAAPRVLQLAQKCACGLVTARD
jgi:pimeloyl-ACP methyl ester carboxylesterase